MDQQTYIITFDNVSDADANHYASELRNILLDISSDIEVHRRRDDRSTQDFGTTLVLILGTSSVTAIATAIGDWLKPRRIGITIKNGKEEIIGTNLTSKDALKLAELLLTKK